MTSKNYDFRILSAPGMDAVLDDIIESIKSERISKWLHEKRFKPKDSFTTYRILNHCTALGLADDVREEDSQTWRLMSVVDLHWLKILGELRKFGLPLESLKRAKETLRINAKHQHQALDVAICLCAQHRPTYIVVFDDGYAVVATNECLEFTDAIMGQQNYIRININRLFREIIGDKDKKFVPKLPTKITLKDKEIDVLTALDEQGIDEVTIRKQHDKITMIDSTKHVDGAASIIEHVKDIEFGEIDIRVEKGKQRHTKITKRRKL